MVPSFFYDYDKGRPRTASLGNNTLLQHFNRGFLNDAAFKWCNVMRSVVYRCVPLHINMVLDQRSTSKVFRGYGNAFTVLLQQCFYGFQLGFSELQSEVKCVPGKELRNMTFINTSETITMSSCALPPVQASKQASWCCYLSGWNHLDENISCDGTLERGWHSSHRKWWADCGASSNHLVAIVEW